MDQEKQLQFEIFKLTKQLEEINQREQKRELESMTGSEKADHFLAETLKDGMGGFLHGDNKKNILEGLKIVE